MRKLFKPFYFVAACAIAATPVVASAQTWAEWTLPADCSSLTTINGVFGAGTVSFSTSSGSAAGVQDAAGGICGDVSQKGAQGNNYFNPSGPYIPTPTNISFVQISQGLTGTITFSQAVIDPYIALISVGRWNQTVGYSFDQAFDVVSDNTSSAAYWGTGSFSVSPDHQQLLGSEFSGVLKFTGTFTSLSFTTDSDEFWHGFTVGTMPSVESAAVVTPEPSTYALMFAGLAGLGVVARRRRIV